MQAQVACRVSDDLARGIGGFRQIKREIIQVTVSAALLGDNNARATMDDIPAGVQRLAYHYVNEL
jgi:hypothetical protein